MKKMFASVAGVVAVAALAGCSSGPTGYGGVQKIDTAKHTVTLYTGNTYQFDDKTDLSKVKVNDVVQIPYVVDGKVNKATSITPYG